MLLLCTLRITQDSFRELGSLGGKWNPRDKKWVFHPSLLNEVKTLLIETYGTDGEIKKTVSIDMFFPEECSTEKLIIAGNIVAQPYNRDGGVRLSGAAVVSGSVYSGGSRRKPVVVFHAGTTLRVFDVPEACLNSIPDDLKAAFWKHDLISYMVVKSD